MEAAVEKIIEDGEQLTTKENELATLAEKDRSILVDSNSSSVDAEIDTTAIDTTYILCLSYRQTNIYHIESSRLRSNS